MDMRVLPEPAAPQTSVGRPWGKPPPVITSKPEIPVGVFCREVMAEDFFFDFGGINGNTKNEEMVLNVRLLMEDGKIK